jgi:hypothetical protein
VNGAADAELHFTKGEVVDDVFGSREVSAPVGRAWSRRGCRRLGRRPTLREDLAGPGSFR